MKKLLSLISMIGLTSTSAITITSVTSCAKADYNDISKIKKSALTISKEQAKDYKANTIEQAIVDVINANISVNAKGDEVKKDSKDLKVKFEISDFSFKVGTADLSDTTDYTNDVSVDVTLKSSNAKKILLGKVTFIVTKKSSDIAKKNMKLDYAGTKLSIEVNKTKKINVTFDPTDKVTKTVTVTSSDTSIINSNVDGKVITLQALKIGQSNISISADGYNTITIEINVTALPPKDMTSDVAGNKLSVEIGTPKNINVTFQQGDTVTKSVTASFTDKTIASATVSGKTVVVNGLKAGKTNITISANGYHSLVIEITVTTPAPKNMTTDVSGNKLSVEIGTPKNINVTFQQGDTATKSVTVGLKDKTIASSTVNGKVITVNGLKAGKTNLTISAVGYKDVVIEITVTAPAPKNMTTDVSGNKLSVEIGTPKNINVTFQQGDTATKSVTATLADKTIASATVSGKTVVVNGLKSGKTNLTISAVGYKDVVIEITVTAPAPQTIK